MRVRKEHSEPTPEKPSRGKPKNRQTSVRLLRINLWCSFIALGLYYCVTIRPETFWFAGLAGFLIPPFLLIQLFFLLYWLSKRPFFVLIPLLTLLLGIRFIQSSIAWHFLQTEKCGNLKVLSLNAKTFGGMDKDKQKENEICTEMVKQIFATKADVLCIQEMFDHPKSSIFNVTRQLRKGGYKYIYFSRSGTMRWGASVGVAICSKYPILSKSIIRKRDGSNNQIIRAKIDVEGQHVVVVNMHLQSIFIKEDELGRKNPEGKGYLAQAWGVLQKLKVAYKARTKQIDLLLASTLDEDLPVIICGDMNDTPYSNAYLRLADSYQNAFEKKGRGFGFTYNGKIPFLRIDHQFCNDRLEVSRFSVNKSFTGSDHHGTEACYTFVRK
jgi:endonuclease/exonuclease/phosphatase family metal-dependent hydrolase